jgi:hypothetical protein
MRPSARTILLTVFAASISAVPSARSGTSAPDGPSAGPESLYAVTSSQAPISLPDQPAGLTPPRASFRLTRFDAGSGSWYPVPVEVRR